MAPVRETVPAVKCYRCGSCLGCAVDCSNAPWNFDKPDTTPMAYLVRLVRWVREVGSYRFGEPTGLCLSDLKWMGHRR